MRAFFNDTPDLTNEEYVEFGELLAQFAADGGKLHYKFGITVAELPYKGNNSNMSRFAFSFASPTEYADNPAVGKYLALCRMYNEEFVNLPITTDVNRLMDSFVSRYTFNGDYGDDFED